MIQTASYLRRRSGGQQVKRIKQAIKEGRTIRLREYHSRVEAFRGNPLVDFSYVDEVERGLAAGESLAEARDSAADLARRKGYEREKTSQGEPYKSREDRESASQENSVDPIILGERLRRLNKRLKGA